MAFVSLYFPFGFVEHGSCRSLLIELRWIRAWKGSWKWEVCIMSAWRDRGISFGITDTLEPEFGWHTPRPRSTLRRGSSKDFCWRFGLVIEVGMSTGMPRPRNLVAPDH